MSKNIALSVALSAFIFVPFASALTGPGMPAPLPPQNGGGLIKVAGPGMPAPLPPQNGGGLIKVAGPGMPAPLPPQNGGEVSHV